MSRRTLLVARARALVLASRGVAFVAVLIVTACSDSATAPNTTTPVTGSSATISVVWNNALLQAIRAAPIPPTIVARDLAIMNTVMYDAWADYDAVAVTTESHSALRRPAAERTDANKRIAMSYAAYRVAYTLLPSQGFIFDATLRAQGLEPCPVCSSDVTTPEGVGVAEAKAVMEVRGHDGSNQLGDLHAGAYSDYTGYVPVNDATHINDPNHWQPLAIKGASGATTTQSYSTPHWGNVKPFALTSGAQFRPASAPNLYPSAGYTQQVQEILDYSANLNDRQKAIAEYWADGPQSELPPGHWILFGEYVSQRDRHTTDDDARMFFALSNAMLDVSIAVWDCKRAFDYVRPVTAVHFLMGGKQVLAWAGPGKGTQLIDGADWQPYQPVNVVTPSFPEFSSGHSAFSAAGAYVLQHFTGSDVFGASVTIPAGSSHVEPGVAPANAVTLTWPTFSAAAEEAAISRRYGGIHFAEGDLQSRAMGNKVAAIVWSHAQQLWSGQSN